MAGNSSHGDNGWVVRFSDALKCKSKASSVCIFKAPATLVNQKEEAYIPRVVSLGPYFFGKPELNAMEKHKSEAARRVHYRMPRNDFSSVVAKIQSRDEEIRNCYDEDIPYDGEVLAWMMARDGSFILEFLRCLTGERLTDVSEQYSLIFDAHSRNAISSDVMQDIFKTGNQIPIFVLEEILAMETQCSLEDAANKLGLMLDGFRKNIEFLTTDIKTCEARESARTLLEVLHYSFTGPSTDKIKVNNADRAMCPKWISKCFGWMSKHNLRDPPNRMGPRRPSAGELHNAGVKLQRLSTEGYPVRAIRFDEKTSTLYLPQSVIDVETETLLRNFMALECCSRAFRSHMPITKYAHFMDSLIDSEKDVALLRKYDILLTKFGSDAQTAEMFNTVSQFTRWAAPYPPVENARAGVEKYYEKRWKILWNEFWEGYCSRPWLVAGSLGAILVVLMTAIQVLCLFYTCNSSP